MEANKTHHFISVSVETRGKGIIGIVFSQRQKYKNKINRMNETMPWKNATISTLEESLLLIYNNMQVLFQNFILEEFFLRNFS